MFHFTERLILHMDICALKVHLNEFLIGQYMKYDIMRHIKSMHLKVGYFVLYIPIYQLTERKKVSMYKTVHVEH